jgi:hypothetical protein
VCAAVVLQVAVFDDAVAGSAALVGVAAVQLASLAEGIPIEGDFCLSNPADAQPAGSIRVSITWHDPWATGNKQLQGRLPLVLQAAEGTAAAATSSSMQEQNSQHQHEVVLQKAVPALASTGISGMPSISAGAVAAVTAALDQQRQPQLPLLQAVSTTRSRAAAAVERNAEALPGVLLLQRPQLVSHSSAASYRYSSVSPAEQLVQHQQVTPAAFKPALLLNTADAAVGKAATVTSGPSGTQVMWQAPAAVEAWSNLDSTIYFKLEALQLTNDALHDPGLQHVLLAHMFCEEFTSAADQCTPTVAKG